MKEPAELARDRSGALTQEAVVGAGLWPSLKRLDHRARHLFGENEVSGRDVLEIGCGNGAYLIWCWANGARRCVGLEPEADGSTVGASAVFEEAIRAFACGEEVGLSRRRLEDLSPSQGYQFDVALLYNVVNHLDEDACARLAEDRDSVEKYVALFRHIGELLRPGGVLIIADCGRSNLFADCGLRNPLAANIEWKKHQNPAVWRAVLGEAGFGVLALRWYRLYPFRGLGRLLANRLVAYLTYSHFVMEFRKV